MRSEFPKKRGIGLQPPGFALGFYLGSQTSEGNAMKWLFNSGRGVIEVTADSNGNGEAYFKGDDMGATVTNWTFTHPMWETEYRLLGFPGRATKEPMILQFRGWVDIDRKICEVS